MTKIIISDIEWDTTDEAGDPRQAQLPLDVEITEDDDLLRDFIDRANDGEDEEEDDTTNRYIHRSEDENDEEDTFRERLEQVVGDAESDCGELSDWLSDHYGWCVNGFTWEVVVE